MADKEKGEAVALGCLLMLVLMPFTILLRAFVLTKLWGWFIVPLGVMQVGLAHAYGLSVAIAMFTPHSIPKEDEEESMAYKVFKYVLTGFILPLIMWLIGWICYCFM